MALSIQIYHNAIDHRQTQAGTDNYNSILNKIIMMQ